MLNVSWLYFLFFKLGADSVLNFIFWLCICVCDCSCFWLWICFYVGFEVGFVFDVEFDFDSVFDIDVEFDSVFDFNSFLFILVLIMISILIFDFDLVLDFSFDTIFLWLCTRLANKSKLFSDVSSPIANKSDFLPNRKENAFFCHFHNELIRFWTERAEKKDFVCNIVKKSVFWETR